MHHLFPSLSHVLHCQWGYSRKNILKPVLWFLITVNASLNSERELNIDSLRIQTIVPEKFKICKIHELPCFEAFRQNKLLNYRFCIGFVSDIWYLKYHVKLPNCLTSVKFHCLVHFSNIASGISAPELSAHL